MVVPVGPRAPPTARSGRRLVVEERQSSGSAGRCGQRAAAVDDGVLQPLAGVDRDQLDRGRVGVEPPGSLAATVRPGPRRSARAARSSIATSPSRSSSADLVQRLADVTQVGEQPLATDHGRARAAGSPRAVAASSTAATPRAANTSAHSRSASGDLVGQVVTARVELGRGVPEEAGERRRRTRGLRCGCSSASSSASHSIGGRGGEHAAAAGDHGRDAGRVQRRLRWPAEVAMPVADDGDVRAAPAGGRRTRRPTPAAPDVEGEVARDVRGIWPTRSGSAPRPPELVTRGATRSRNGRPCGARSAERPGDGPRRRARRSVGRRARHRPAPSAGRPGALRRSAS